MSANNNFDEEVEGAPVPDEAEVAEEEQTEPPKAKSSGFLFKFIVILIAVVGGGFYFLKMNGMQLPFAVPGLGAPPAVEQAVEIIPATSPPPQVAAVAQPVPVPEETAAAAPPPMEASMSMPMPIAIEPAADPLAWGGGEPSAVPQEVSAMMQQAPALAVESSVPAPALSPDAQGPFPDPAAAFAAPAMQQVAAPQPDPELAMKIEELLGRIAVLEAGLEEAKMVMAPRGDVDALKESVSKIEVQMQEENDKKKNAAALKEARREVEDYRNGKMPDVVKASSATAAKPKAPKAAKTPAVMQSAQQWVLKSAKPGIAWVAQKGSSELKTVAVGDSLAGVGKITAIVKDSTGRWVVSGTRGRIGQ